ncbi:hypothetical protein V8C86DRAFT_3099576 [Haematococcus lacustris]
MAACDVAVQHHWQKVARGDEFPSPLAGEEAVGVEVKKEVEVNMEVEVKMQVEMEVKKEVEVNMEEEVVDMAARYGGGGGGPPRLAGQG